MSPKHVYLNAQHIKSVNSVHAYTSNVDIQYESVTNWQYRKSSNTSRASNTSWETDLIVLIEAGPWIEAGPQIQAGVQKLAQLVNLLSKRLLTVYWAKHTRTVTELKVACFQFASKCGIVDVLIQAGPRIEAGPWLQAGGLTRLYYSRIYGT